MKLYQSINGVSGVESIDVSETHSGSCSNASVVCQSTTLSIGDSLVIDAGYTDNHGTIFSGFVKQISYSIPEKMYTIQGQDAMIRAVDYFIAADTPDSTFKRSDIAAEELVEQVLELAGITSYDYQATYYVCAVNGTTAEVSLVTAYDYCRSIADLIAWNLWADRTGTIQFRNRKPYVMTGTSGQPGDVADSPIAVGISDEPGNRNLLTITYTEDEGDLRNKIVVWGTEGVSYTASASSPYLPSGFYKTILFSNTIIGNSDAAQKTANYNLALYNHLTKQVSVSVVGDYRFEARKTVNLYEEVLGIDQQAYIYSARHNWSKEGYICSMELRLT
jgi:hypothetical protein